MVKELPQKLNKEIKMSITDAKKIAVRVVATFVEAGVAYMALNSWNINNKTVVAGAVGAGLSAVFNLVKHYTGA